MHQPRVRDSSIKPAINAVNEDLQRIARPSCGLPGLCTGAGMWETPTIFALFKTLLHFRAHAKI